MRTESCRIRQKPSHIKIVFLLVLIIVSFLFEAEKLELDILGPALFGMVCRGNPLTCPCSIVGSILRPGPEEYMISIDYAVTDEFSLE